MFNKQFVSDVLNVGSNVIVCGTCTQAAVCALSVSLYFSLAGVCVCDLCVSLLCRDQDGRTICEGLQLYLNGIMGQDGWLLPPRCVSGPSSSGATRLWKSGNNERLYTSVLLYTILLTPGTFTFLWAPGLTRVLLTV